MYDEIDPSEEFWRGVARYTQKFSGRAVQQSSSKLGASFMAGSKPAAIGSTGPATNIGWSVVGPQLVPKIILRTGAGRSAENSSISSIKWTDQKPQVNTVS